jgi:hypothetical protein
VLLHWLGGNFDTLEIVGLRMAENGIATLMLYMPATARAVRRTRRRRSSGRRTWTR